MKKPSQVAPASTSASSTSRPQRSQQQAAAPGFSSWRGERPRAAGASGEQAGLLSEHPWLLHYESGVPHTVDIPRLLLTRQLVSQYAHEITAGAGTVGERLEGLGE